VKKQLLKEGTLDFTGHGKKAQKTLPIAMRRAYSRAFGAEFSGSFIEYECKFSPNEGAAPHTMLLAVIFGGHKVTNGHCIQVGMAYFSVVSFAKFPNEPIAVFATPFEVCRNNLGCPRLKRTFQAMLSLTQPGRENHTVFADRPPICLDLRSPALHLGQCKLAQQLDFRVLEERKATSGSAFVRPFKSCAREMS
jgi:hypothetical protein